MSESFDAVDVITTKRDRHELSDDQIRWVIEAYTRGVVAEEQMSALAMAVLLNGMTRREIAPPPTMPPPGFERVRFVPGLVGRSIHWSCSSSIASSQNEPS